MSPDKSRDNESSVNSHRSHGPQTAIIRQRTFQIWKIFINITS